MKKMKIMITKGKTEARTGTVHSRAAGTAALPKSKRNEPIQFSKNELRGIATADRHNALTSRAFLRSTIINAENSSRIGEIVKR